MVKKAANKTYFVRKLENQGNSGGQGLLMPLSADQWEEADLLEDFAFPWTEAEAPRTSFRALWDGEYFRFRYEVEDGDVVMAIGKNAMEKVVGSDRVEIFLTTGAELDPYYGLEIDPRGEVLAYQGKYHRIMNWEWECPDLQVWAEVTGTGYEVEVVIPVETLKNLNCLHTGIEGDYLQAGLFRAEFSQGSNGGAVNEDWISWVDPGGETPDFHVPTAFGVLELER